MLKKFLLSLLTISLLAAIIIITCLAVPHFKPVKLTSQKDIEELLDIDLGNIEITDIKAMNYGLESEMIMYYTVPDEIVDDSNTYRYKEDYNPLPSFSPAERYFPSSAEDYLSANDISPDGIAYGNSFGNDYVTETFLYELYEPFSITVYVFRDDDDDRRRVLLRAYIPSRIEFDIQ